ncbi:hypothetical protein FRC09_013697, partial [Ceratobasidium sp. 395]
DDRWVTEAVQIGEPGSAAGFIGTWTGNNHEPDDPAGPTWLWKIADVSEIPKDDALGALNFGFGEDDEDDEDEDEDDEGYDDMGMEDDGASDSEEDEDGSDSGDTSDNSDSDDSIDESMPSLIPISSLYELD